MITSINRLTGEPSNDQRAEWTREPLNAFAKETYGGQTFDDAETDGLEGDATTMIGDLITDLLHMAVKLGFSLEQAQEVGHAAIRSFSDEHEIEVNALADMRSVIADLANQFDAAASGAGEPPNMTQSGLCEIFVAREPGRFNTCTTCPVKMKTGLNFCGGTPVEEFADGQSCKEDAAIFAKKQADFLRSLLENGEG